MEVTIPIQFQPISDGIKTLSESDINCMVIKSKPGLGKSWWTDYILRTNNINHVVFKGYISEARFFKFIQDNSDKVIVMRDCGSMFNSKFFLDFLKSATDTTSKRNISRMTYAEHEGVEDTIEFKGKLIWELNEVPKKHKEDIEAILSRSVYIELNLTFEDISTLMKQITPEALKEVTDYLIGRSRIIGITMFNFRTQYMCFKIYEVCIKNHQTNWKERIDMFFNAQMSDMRKMLYRFAGLNPIKRITFVRYLMIDNGFEYRTAQRKIADNIEIEEIYTNGLDQDMLISIKPFGEPQVISVS